VASQVALEHDRRYDQRVADHRRQYDRAEDRQRPDQFRHRTCRRRRRHRRRVGDVTGRCHGNEAALSIPKRLHTRTKRRRRQHTCTAAWT